MSRTCEELAEQEQLENKQLLEPYDARAARLPAYLAEHVRTLATALAAWSRDVPLAPKTIFGIVASIASGAPEAEFSPDDVIMLAFAAGELNGLAFGLDVPLPLLLLAAGVEETLAADDEAMANARSMAEWATRAGGLTRS